LGFAAVSDNGKFKDSVGLKGGWGWEICRDTALPCPWAGRIFC